jgi:YbbR domain-containing protein
MRVLRELLQLVLENWTLKLTAVFLGFALWLVVRGDPGAERVITVPLEISIPRTMEIVRDRPSTVDVTLRGTAGSTWLAQQISCMVDLRSAQEGEHIVPLTPENIQFPRAAGLEIVGIRPARVLVDLERTVSKEVPVSVATRGDPAQGYDVYAKSAQPSRVNLSGPRSRVENIAEVSTESIALSDRKESFRASTNLNIQDPLVHSDPVGPISVSINIGVHRRTITIHKVAVSADAGLSVAPQYVTVQLLVPQDMSRKITAADLSATVLETELALSESSRKVKPAIKLVKAPDAAIAIKEVLPAEVTVRKKEKS